MFLSFFSCTNVLEERSESTSKEVSVSFNFGSSRTIVSSAEAEKYFYTLKGTLSGETKSFCEKLAYSSFIAKAFDVKKGEWTFEITAYNNDKPVYSDSKTVKLTTSENTVSFVLRAVTGGTGSVSVKLKYPANKGVSKVTASFYDDIAGSDSGTALTLNESDSSVTFSSDAVPSGVNKLIKFYLYDSQNVCIGSYVENVFIANGDSLSVERTLENVNTFAVTVYLKVKGQPWSDSCSKIKAVKDGKEYLLSTTAGTNVFTASLPLGCYNIYEGSEDTGVDLQVTYDDTRSVIVDLDCEIATSENIDNIISSLSSASRIIVTGEFDATKMKSIGKAIKNSLYDIELDLTRIEKYDRIPAMAFEGCTKLTKILFPDSLIKILNNAFDGCIGLTTIDIPESVTIISARAFYNCTNLKSINISESANIDVGAYAFYNCKSLTSFNLSPIPLLRKYLFAHCESLSTITIPSTVTNIENSVFRGCKNLKSVEIPVSVEELGISVFEDCEKLTNIIVDNANQYYTSEDGILFNKDKSVLICYPAGKAGASYTVPSSVTRIERYAFSGCQYLSELVIPSTVTDFPGSVFYGCSSLTSITLPSTITSISNSWFSGCSNLISLTIPQSVTEIGDNAFFGCSSLISINIPASVENIGKQAFNGCTKLKNFSVDSSNLYFAQEEGVLFNKDKTKLLYYPAGKNDSSYTIPTSVNTIGEYAFAEIEGSNLSNVIIPSSVNEIEASAFIRNTSLESIVIPDSVTNIGSNVFNGCSSLTTITLPESITSIDHGTFKECSSLTTIELPQSITSIDMGAFQDCTKLKAITLPESLHYIKSSTFKNCTSLTSINLPSLIVEISGNAFENCINLTAIEIPSTVTKLRQNVFAGCTKLQSIKFLDSSNWYYSSRTSIDGSEILIDLSNQTNNVQYFVDIYKEKYWYKISQ